MPSREWLETEVTISREELGEIIAGEIASVLQAAEMVGNNELTSMIKDLLTDYSAAVATEIFRKVEEDI